jgi:hypothetical protein
MAMKSSMAINQWRGGVMSARNNGNHGVMKVKAQ